METPIGDDVLERERLQFAQALIDFVRGPKKEPSMAPEPNPAKPKQLRVMPRTA